MDDSPAFNFFTSNHLLETHMSPHEMGKMSGSVAPDSVSPSSTTTSSSRPRKKKRMSSGALDDGDSDDNVASEDEKVKRAIIKKGKAAAKDGLSGDLDNGKKNGSAGAKGKAKSRANGDSKPSADKKKKAGRACAACQKAHLTCDDGRPCIRCIKKGCPEQCHDGARKKAKYLQEIPDELLERRPPTVALPLDQAQSTPSEPVLSLDSLPPQPNRQVDDFLPAAEPSAPTFSYDSYPMFDNTTFASEFGSEAANLEYAILSSMLNGNGFALDNPYSTTGMDGQAQANGSSMLLNSPLAGTLGLGGSVVPNMTFSGSSLYTGPNAAGKEGQGSRTPPSGQLFNTESMSPGLQAQPREDLLQGVRDAFKDQARYGIPHDQPSGDASAFQEQPQAVVSTENMDQPQQQVQRDGEREQTQSLANASRVLTAEEVYRNVTRPYPYAQSYHFLVRHLKERFEKNDILRIIRALATFRPSLIALQMPLTDEDETFVERTFQRTLVELNKLISFSGTPTVVWRRTGEICLVGAEFCLLTGWSREELVGKKYIFELFDTASVVEYYESFARHAFESTSSSVEMQCVVLGPSGKPVPSAFCYSVRRDLFSLPFLVIGSFLPVLV